MTNMESVCKKGIKALYTMNAARWMMGMIMVINDTKKRRYFKLREEFLESFRNKVEMAEFYLPRGCQKSC